MDYQKRVKKASPSSPIGKNIFFAYVIGGGICCLGELLQFLYEKIMPEDTASTWVTVSLIFLGVLGTATGVFDRVAKIAGAGTLVPVTGFANAVASPALEFKAEGYVTGLGAKMFIIAGPVIVYGIIASVLCGILLLL